MSLLAIGLSHRSAPMTVLEEAALDASEQETFATALAACENIREVIVLGTCNRLEVYAEATTFHGALTEIGQCLVDATGIERERLTDFLYVHYEERAIAHLFSVASGLDSMAVGEAQILGQLRTSLRRSQDVGHAGPVLNALVQQALRVAKRVHTDTGLDKAGPSLVEAGVGAATAHVGDLSEACVLVLGAGAMSSLAATTVSRMGCRDLVVVNRTHERAQRLAVATSGRAETVASLGRVLAEADIVISCTGAVGYVLDTQQVLTASAARCHRPQAYVDLALPRDVHPDVASTPGVVVHALADLGEIMTAAPDCPGAVAEAQDVVTAEVAAFLAHRRTLEVAPTVAALRARAQEVLQGEFTRLNSRLPGLDRSEQDEVRLAMHRVVEKLLHTPTVRVKELTGTADPSDYAHALRELFDLDPYEVAAVSTPPEKGGLA
ncbi:glutamyl-tRNA reductase [Austwickia chelonae]|uniref:Glutamyl-tRNA reductase n=1 Tax=Austwickia chelonae NBRC 105200 TaxID=1184607 RepID=K6W4Z9_9MICO|nr:glutamyl-tRNA reductase [Austwickia chelonae]GAB76902.1 glutamyl-tRNA reductase [Austwickia chelonae NBRC 105200]SEW32152.1 glutamyl-tRNA reductase [Austwickia chelonae]